MTFTWPFALLGLLAVPLVVAAYLIVQHRRPKYAVRFTNLDLLANVVDRSPGARRHIPPALYVLALAALTVSIARPHIIHAEPKQEGTVILVTDVSASMTATDIEPTRIAAAQAAARTMVETLPKNTRIGLISFSTGARLLAAPTTDKAAVLAAVDRLTPAGGTAMGDALMSALDVAGDIRKEGPAARIAPTPVPAAGAGEGSPVIIVLLSDGASTSGSIQPMEAAATAAERGVPVFAIALGTAEGVVTVTDANGRQRTQNVPPDEATLKAIAETTAGRFFAAPSAQDLQSIYEELGQRIGFERKVAEVSWAFAAAAALLVVVAGGLGLVWFNRFP